MTFGLGLVCEGPTDQLWRLTAPGPRAASAVSSAADCLKRGINAAVLLDSNGTSVLDSPHGVLTGTNRGRRIRVWGIIVSRLRDGRIVEDWTGFDRIALVRQLSFARTVLAAPVLLRATRAARQLTTALRKRFAVGLLNPRVSPVIAGHRTFKRDTETSQFAGLSWTLRKPSHCLPCRRSWVRVPSAALRSPANRG